MKGRNVTLNLNFDCIHECHRQTEIWLHTVVWGHTAQLLASLPTRQLIPNICDQLHVKPRAHKNGQLKLTPLEAHSLFKNEDG